MSTDDASPAVSYSGSWTLLKGDQVWSGDEHSSAGAGDSATFAFRGPSVVYVYAPYPNMGIAEVSIDGQSVGTIDEYCPSKVYQASRIFAGLTPGDHTITVTALGTKRREALGAYVTVDAFITAGSGRVSPPPRDIASHERRP